MTIPKTAFKSIGVAVLAAITLAGCNDFLGVENLNEPDRERALAEPGDVESLIGSTYFVWWSNAEHQNPQMGLSVAADEYSYGGGNFAMGDLSRQPRQEWNNDPSYRRSSFIENPWYGMYNALSSLNDGLGAIDAGLEIGDDGEDTPRALAFGKFVQGLSHGFLALMFDKAVIVDETVDLNAGDQEMRPYNEVMDAAMAQFQEAIQIAESNEFTLPDAWINGNPMSSDEFARLVRSYMARYTAQVARTPEERAAVDWERVIDLVDNGIQEDFAVEGDGLGPDKWGFFNMKVIAEQPGWGRTHNRMLGPADTSGRFEQWKQTPPQERAPFVIETNDRRIVGADSATAPGKDYMYTDPRHGSYYRHHRYEDVRLNSMVGPLVAIKMAEMDMLKAEALLRLGRDLDEVARLINKTRVARGELSPAAAGDGAGSWDDEQDASPGASLWAKLKHEKRVETYATSTGIAFFDDRGWNDLVQGTPLQFPVPGQELEILGLDGYTFGGSGEWASDSGIQ